MVWPIFRFIQYFWLPGFNDQVNTEHLIYIRHSLDANIPYKGLGSLFFLLFLLFQLMSLVVLTMHMDRIKTMQILGHLKITKK